MIKLLDILRESEESILVTRRSKEERKKNHAIALQKQIKHYIANGSKGDLNLNNTPITSLPQDLRLVGGRLNLRDTNITTLPQDLKVVDGNLDLSGTKITSLPEDLEVRGDLNLYNTPITSLPQGLKVKKILILQSTPITSLPQDLEVGGVGINLKNTPISKRYTVEQIKQMCPSIKGQISL